MSPNGHLALKTISAKSLLLWACFSVFTEAPLFNYLMTNIIICSTHCLTLIVYKVWQEMPLAPIKCLSRPNQHVFSQPKLQSQLWVALLPELVKKLIKKHFGERCLLISLSVYIIWYEKPIKLPVLPTQLCESKVCHLWEVYSASALKKTLHVWVIIKIGL